MLGPLEEIENIEDEKAHRDIGKTAYRIWCGARSGGANRWDACSIVYAWFLAMFEQAIEPEEKED